MDEQLKIYWKLYEEYYSNEKLLKNFTNLMDIYHSNKNGKIADIGCGQSEYLLDFYKNSNHELFAIDDEPIQINALKKRIEKIDSKNQITFYNTRYPSSELSDLTFSGVIVSNLLHFMNLKKAKEFIESIEKNIIPGSVVLFTTHSWKHSTYGDYRYFKHYFREEDFYELLPEDLYEYLYVDIKSASFNDEKIKFIKEWLKRVAHQNNIFDNNRIKKMQQEYIKELDKEQNITIVVKRKQY
jgi:SAM-dependent methyltransferase